MCVALPRFVFAQKQQLQKSSLTETSYFKEWYEMANIVVGVEVFLVPSNTYFLIQPSFRKQMFAQGELAEMSLPSQYMFLYKYVLKLQRFFRCLCDYM